MESIGMEDVAGLLLSMRVRGIKIWTDQGQLHYEAPRGILTSSDVAALRTSKGKIISFLQHSRGYTSTKEPLRTRHPSDKVPLAIVQFFFWNLIKKRGNQSTRPPVLIKRLIGHLEIGALECALVELTRRHEILRTAIAVDGSGNPFLRVKEPSEIVLERIYLRGKSTAEYEDNASCIIKQLAEESIDVTADPLFKPGLLVLGEEDHIFFLLMDHILFDGLSTQILERDLATLFVHAAFQRPFSLPEIAMQFPDYAVWQQRTRASRVDIHDEFWRKHLSGARHVRVFSNERSCADISRPVRYSYPFDRSLTIGLRRFSLERRTTLMMSLLCVAIALLSRWCRVEDLVIKLPTNVRRFAEIANTVGPIGTSLFLRVSVFEDDSFVDLLTRVIEEYGIAFDHNDEGKLSAKEPAPEFASNALFNFMSERHAGFLRPKWSSVAQAGKSLREEPFRFKQTLDRIDFGHIEPELFFYETQDDIAGSLVYRSNLATLSSVERFVKHIQLFALRLVNEPSGRIPDVVVGAAP